MHSVMVIQVAPMMYFALKIEVGRGAISHIHAFFSFLTLQHGKPEYRFSAHPAAFLMPLGDTEKGDRQSPD